MKQAFKSLLPLHFPLLLLLLISTTAPAQTISGLRSGVVAYWSFDENFKADFGGESFDLTSSAQQPTISGNDATFQAAAIFNSANSNYLKTLSNINSDDADFSYYVRYKPTTAITNGNRYFVMESSQTEHSISFGLRNDGQSSNIPRSEVYTRNSAGTTFYHQPNAGGNYGVSVNSWQNIIVIYTKADKTYRMYINGVAAAGTLTHTGVLKGGGLVIGSYRSSDARFWQGAIDEVTIWNRSLIPVEIAALQNTKIKIALQKASVTSVNSSGASFSISSGENLTAYYKVTDASTTCPTAQNLKTDILATTLLLNNTSSTINVSSLNPSTNYKLCHVAMDGANLMGAVLETSFTTETSLPLTWISFTVQQEKENALLQWETSSEHNTKSFLVQHSLNGVDFTTVGTVPAAGNSADRKHYRFIHRNPENGSNFYRIQQTDIDDRTSYSRIAAITMDVKGSAFTILSNPVQGNHIRIQLTEKSMVSLFTATGQLVWKNELLPGITSIHAGSLSKGIYLLQVNAAITRIVIK